MHVVSPLYDSTSPFPELDVSSLSDPYWMLTVEPLPFSILVQELHHHPQSMSTSFPWALCATLIARLPSTTPVPRSTPQMGIRGLNIPLRLVLRRPTTLVHHSRQSADYLGRYTFSVSPLLPRLLHHLLSRTCILLRCPPLNVISSSRVSQTQTQNSPYSNYYVTR